MNDGKAGPVNHRANKTSIPPYNSSESIAQKHDSQSVSSPEISVTRSTVLSLYRLVPTAAPNDSNWDNAPSHGEVVVCAESAADARIVAAGRELDFMDIDAAPAEDVTTTNASAFRNERLYSVIAAGPAQAGMQRGVVGGEVRTDNITPAKL
jgi:hypothetical protein